MTTTSLSQFPKPHTSFTCWEKQWSTRIKAYALELKISSVSLGSVGLFTEPPCVWGASTWEISCIIMVLTITSVLVTPAYWIEPPGFNPISQIQFSSISWHSQFWIPNELLCFCYYQIMIQVHNPMCLSSSQRTMFSINIFSYFPNISKIYTFLSISICFNNFLTNFLDSSLVLTSDFSSVVPPGCSVSNAQPFPLHHLKLTSESPHLQAWT